ncbi:hypothetical protein Nepgr_011190 [Nepenthes gracilis]|uniref:Protein kinase domain-containing protein n=1 Tax=Nepenthes gracilis TaxID=150966 RepID=A0AAD3SER8_NEPGR|nr:hypothetical protein Nepgr_011190 [Nepenthes gracilis]
MVDPSIFSVIVLVVWYFGLFVTGGNSEPVDDKNYLLNFSYNLPHLRELNWRENSSVCGNWTGVTCNSDNSSVIALRLPAVGFNGQIPNNTLGRLLALQILSLRSNNISGPLPPDLSNLRNLSVLCLQYNNFSGPLPTDFSVWKYLTVVNLSNNGFIGGIPQSMSKLTQLTSLDLSRNLLSGGIPDLGMPGLQQLDLSHNNLTGAVPKSLQRFPSSAFIGNHVTLANSPQSSSAFVPSSQVNQKPKDSRKLRDTLLEAIIIGCSIFGLVAFIFLFLVCCSRKKREVGFTGKFPKGNLSPEKAISGGQDAKSRMVFFEGYNYAFDLEDLLRASAEVLGKGTFGMSYKAILEDANTVVVKRLKDVSAGKREFEQQLEVIGSIRHENVVALRAYYYSKDEKLMVNDYCSHGSVSALLHGRRDEDGIPLDWETRLRIAIGAARGITCIHACNGGKLVHGNIRSTNIFLNSQRYGQVADFGLATIMSPLALTISRASGYRAPEVTDTRKASQSSDVYSFGVFLLELLTGKSPVHTTGSDELVHLVRWVHSVVHEEWTAEVFDIELMKCPNIEEEMVELLQIAMACAARVPEQRPKMADVLKMMENIRQNDTETQPETSSAPVLPQ